MSWLTGWAHRKSHVISNSGAELTNYQIKLIVHRSDGSDSGDDVYIGSSGCESDYDDIRFTKSDGTTLLDYWIEESDSSDATIWVEVDTIAASGNTTIYLYYGNAGASAYSNGDDTFDFFDDFPGSSVDTAKWTVSGSPTVTGGTLIISPEESVVGKTNFGVNYIVRVRMKSSAFGFASVPYFGFRATGDGAFTWTSDPGGIFCIYTLVGASGTRVVISSNPSIDTYYTCEISRRSTTSVLFSVSGFSSVQSTTNIPSASVPITLATTGAEAPTVTYDWILIRKYAATEPTHGAWGSEEKLSCTQTIIGKYNVGEFVSQQIVGKYNVNIISSLIGKYDVGSIVSQPLIGKYNLSYSVGSSLVGKYNVDIISSIIGKYNVNVISSITGKYSIGSVASSSLTGKYTTFICSSILGKYNSVGLDSSLSSTYNILHPVHSNFVIELFDPVFTSGQFTNLSVNRGENQIDTCEVQFINPSAANQSYIRYNAPIRLRVNDKLVFSGNIKRIEKDENINVWSVFGEGGAAELRDLSVATTINYQNTQPYYIIYDLLPATNWTIITHSGFGDYIDYQVTPGGVLDHVDNVCKMTGWGYTTRQHAQYTYINGISGNDITLDYTPTPDGYWDDRYGVMNTGASANYGFTITSHTGDTITVDSVPANAAVGDQMVLYGKYWLDVGTRIGSNTTGTVAHYVMNENCVWLNKKENVDAIITSVVARGINSEVANETSWATACTDNYTKLLMSESFLSLPATSGATMLYLDDTTFYPDTGRVQISDEKIDYTNKGATYLYVGSTTNRGMDSTSAATHYPYDDVLFITSMDFEDLSAFPTTSGTIVIGKERIEYDTISGNTAYTLTRGSGGSDAYRHSYGVYGFDGTYSDSSPETNSPVHLYGIRKKVVNAVGATTQDALDKRAQHVLFENDDNIVYGDFTLLSTDFWEEIRPGDYFKFTDANSNDYEWKIVSVDYDQFRPITIHFGRHDDYILEDIADIKVVDESAREKSTNTATATILELSTDEKWGRVEYSDGTIDWIELI